MGTETSINRIWFGLIPCSNGFCSKLTNNLKLLRDDATLFTVYLNIRIVSYMLLVEGKSVTSWYVFVNLEQLELC